MSNTNTKIPTVFSIPLVKYAIKSLEVYVAVKGALICVHCGNASGGLQKRHFPGCKFFDKNILTASEYKIFDMLAEAKTVKDIAIELNLSYKTVGTHKYNIFKKLGVHSTPELLKFVYASKLKELEQDKNESTSTSEQSATSQFGQQ